MIPWRLPPKNLNLGLGELPWGQTEFKRLSEQTNAFQEVAAFESTWFNLTGAGEPALMEGLSVSAPFFSVLGVAPQLGRTFTPAEDQPGKEREVILSDKLWRTKFAASRAILGQASARQASAKGGAGYSPYFLSFSYSVEGAIPSVRAACTLLPRTAISV